MRGFSEPMSEGPPTSGSGDDLAGQQPAQPAQPEVPAGWYPHPTAPGWEAYWTGSGWGNETRPAPAPPEQQPAAQEPQAAAEQQPVAAETQPAAQAQPAAQEPQAATPAAEAASVPAQQQPVAATPVAATPAVAAKDGRSDSTLPVILCVLGAVVAVVGSFLPQATLDFNGNSIDLADNTMVAAGYGIAAIAAAVLAAAVAAWAYLKASRSWIPILLGVVVVAIAVYAGTAGLDVAPDFAPAGLTLDDQGSPSTGIFAVGVGGLLIVLGGVGLVRENR